jgi:predicted CopG family antitoxin
MAFKTLTIKEDAYDVLNSMKKPGESFSELILRIGGERPVTAKDLFGRSKHSKKDLEILRKHAREARKRLNEGLKRRRDVLTRHLGTD